MAVACVLAVEAGAQEPDGAPEPEEDRQTGETELPEEHCAAEAPPVCPPEMLLVAGFCIDRWEASFVDHETSEVLSPYYPPHPGLLHAARSFWQLERLNTGDESARGMPLPELPPVQREGNFEGRAVSRPGVVPQAYLNYPLAKRGCELAGKRLCTRDEWLTACRGAARTPYPYGLRYEQDKCNVYRAFHPAAVLHGNASTGHRDPRLNLLFEVGVGSLLRSTGDTATCASRWGDDAAYDMVGNIDEWIEDESGTFVGGFYSRSTRKGCAAQVTAHGPTYYDYSLGTRCCASVTLPEPDAPDE
ncbi:MAG TPA: SUMF1/EgtB/PvdO family nonheme iron enzyme [Polyangiaceae bacterium]|nr:SUMF1/EgtB/PvdO family nonheme iron enzyme [Polyangiaceae bacterium]